jgi:hypothetical protein
VKPPVSTAVSPLGEERASSSPHHPLRIIQECSMTTPAMTTRLLATRVAVAVVVLAATVSLFVTALDAAG